jgi:hypothetical protein
MMGVPLATQSFDAMNGQRMTPPLLQVICVLHYERLFAQLYSFLIWVELPEAGAEFVEVVLLVDTMVVRRKYSVVVV